MAEDDQYYCVSIRHWQRINGLNRGAVRCSASAAVAKYPSRRSGMHVSVCTTIVSIRIVCMYSTYV